MLPLGMRNLIEPCIHVTILVEVGLGASDNSKWKTLEHERIL